MPGFRFRGLAQKRAIAIALRGLGKLRQAPRGVREFGAAAKTVGSKTLHETVPGAAAKIVAKGVADAPFMAGQRSEAIKAIPENVKRFGTALFGHKGAIGRGVKSLQQVIHKFQRSKVRAPGTKMVVGAAGKMADETSKIVGNMGRQALETVGETPTGRILAGSHRVAQKLFESPLPKPGAGLVPPVGSAMRDVRHTSGLTGRLGLKIKRKVIDPQAQGLREFIHKAIGGKRTPFSSARLGAANRIPPITERRRAAAASIRGGTNILNALKERGGIRAAGGLTAAKREVGRANKAITGGLEEHRAIRRTVRTRGLQDIPLVETAIAGGVGSYLIGKKIKQVGAEMKQAKARREARATDEFLYEEQKRLIRAREPWLTETDIENRAFEAHNRRILARKEAAAILDAREATGIRTALEREAIADRKAAVRTMTKIKARTPVSTQSKTPRESTLNSIKGKIGRLGELFGGGKKTSTRRRKKRK
jgi:hypothetical protein